MENVNATRMSLLLKREETKDARSGAELLRNKKDVLLNEFFSTLKALIALRETLDTQADAALRSLAFALGLEGREKLNSFSFLGLKPPSFEIHYKNLLGLKIPEIAVEAIVGRKGEIPIRVDTSQLIIETKESFDDFLSLILKILPQELKLKRVGQEIKNTTRKVNSLEKYVIPKLHSQIKFIRESLEEREREDIFRLKRFKKRLALIL